MGKARRDTRTWRRESWDEDRHWLGEGIAGQESLLSEITPLLYTVDPLVAKHAGQIAHYYNGTEERPLAAVIAPQDSVPWHVGYLSKHFDVCLLVEEYDPMLEALTTRFDVSVFEGHVPDSLHGSVDLLIFTRVSWMRVEMLSNTIQLAKELLTPSGRAMFVVPCFANDGVIALKLEEGEQIEKSEFLRSYEFSLFASVSEVQLPLDLLVTDPTHGISDFSKRHKEFFGKSARDLCLSRLYEQDFRDQMFHASQPLSALLVALGESESFE